MKLIHKLWACASALVFSSNGWDTSAINAVVIHLPCSLARCSWHHCFVFMRWRVGRVAVPSGYDRWCCCWANELNGRMSSLTLNKSFTWYIHDNRYYRHFLDNIWHNEPISSSITSMHHLAFSAAARPLVDTKCRSSCWLCPRCKWFLCSDSRHRNWLRFCLVGSGKWLLQCKLIRFISSRLSHQRQVLLWPV